VIDKKIFICLWSRNDVFRYFTESHFAKGRFRRNGF